MLMDALPPPDYPSEEDLQIPTRTSPATLQASYASFISGNIQKFSEILDSESSLPGFDICDFHEIMIKAIGGGHVQFIKKLLDHGFSRDPFYALQAAKTGRVDALQVFLENGWVINQPLSELKPPVLG